MWMVPCLSIVNKETLKSFSLWTLSKCSPHSLLLNPDLPQRRIHSYFAVIKLNSFLPIFWCLVGVLVTSDNHKKPFQGWGSVTEVPVARRSGFDSLEPIWKYKCDCKSWTVDTGKKQMDLSWKHDGQFCRLVSPLVSSRSSEKPVSNEKVMSNRRRPRILSFGL